MLKLGIKIMIPSPSHDAAFVIDHVARVSHSPGQTVSLAHTSPEITT